MRWARESFRNIPCCGARGALKLKTQVPIPAEVLEVLFSVPIMLAYLLPSRQATRFLKMPRSHAQQKCMESAVAIARQLAEEE